ncbi:hypothetical protein C7271_18045 [filamentous cyanobacterium CCP5]|nr:hypothetical protein C7271_18045 [filamentous cyanobacterium CCP5]
MTLLHTPLTKFSTLSTASVFRMQGLLTNATSRGLDVLVSIWVRQVLVLTASALVMATIID